MHVRQSQGLRHSYAAPIVRCLHCWAWQRAALVQRSDACHHVVDHGATTMSHCPGKFNSSRNRCTRPTAYSRRARMMYTRRFVLVPTRMQRRRFPSEQAAQGFCGTFPGFPRGLTVYIEDILPVFTIPGPYAASPHDRSDRWNPRSLRRTRTERLLLPSTFLSPGSPASPLTRTISPSRHCARWHRLSCCLKVISFNGAPASLSSLAPRSWADFNGHSADQVCSVGAEL